MCYCMAFESDSTSLWSVANTCVSDFLDLPLSRKLVYMCVHRT